MLFYKECINFDDITLFSIITLPDQYPNFKMVFFAGGHLLIINIMYYLILSNLKLFTS